MPDIYFYNTLTREKERFVSVEPMKARIYSCGPTVYDFLHIGNMRSYIFADILKRTFLLNGYGVKHIINITDVGHLTGENFGDADEGEDKMEKGARHAGKTVWEIAKMYTDIFFDDMRKLHILPPEKYVRATEHIEEQIDMIQKLEQNGFIYETDEAIYFDVMKVSDYTAFSRQNLDEKQIAVRAEVKTDFQKRNPQDFALWFKCVGRFKNHIMRWSSPWGEGFPGWHIECSAMSVKYLGNEIDIHTGGIDHVSVHHTNERAQNIGVFGTGVVRTWMHNEFLLVDGEKMSKSLGNTYTVSDMIKNGFDPLAFRYFILGAHYRSKLNFTWQSLKAAQTALMKLYTTFLSYPKLDAEPPEFYVENFFTNLNNDLNTPKVLALLWKLIKDEKISPEKKRAVFLAFDSVLGLGFIEKKDDEPSRISEEIVELMTQRETARKNKDFVLADTLRQMILKKGYEIHDTSEGPKAIALI